jgi:hypothetical protein
MRPVKHLAHPQCSAQPECHIRVLVPVPLSAPPSASPSVIQALLEQQSELIATGVPGSSPMVDPVRH